MSNIKSLSVELQGNDPCIKSVPTDFSGVFLFYSFSESFKNKFDCYKHVKQFTVIGQSIESLEGIHHLEHLEELFLAECDLKQETVGPLSGCLGLKRLHLYCNDIKAVPDLSKLTKLTHLWLSDNQIHSLQNINTLTSLTELYISNNNISKIDVKLKSSLRIEFLNLSGNPITNIKEVLRLSPLRRLRWLLMSDPLARHSPAALLTHFRHFVVHSLPQLEGLDTSRITPAERKRVEAFYQDKIQYYRLKLSSELAVLHDDRRNVLEAEWKDLEMIWSALHSHGILRKKTASEEINHIFWEGEAKRWKERSTLSLHYYERLVKFVKHKYEIELEYSGSLGFEEVDFEKSEMLLKSFLCRRIKHKILELKLLHVWSVSGPHTTKVLQSHFLKSLDDVFILCPVQDLGVGSMEYVEEWVFKNKSAGGPLTLTNCLATSDPLISDVTAVHRQLLLQSQTLSTSRLLLLCGISSAQGHQLSQDQVCDAPHHSPGCRVLSAPDVTAIVPLYLVHYKYVFEDYFRPLRAPSKGVIPEVKTVLSNPQSITQLVVNSANLINLMDFPAMENVTTVDLSYNHLQDLSLVGKLFPKLTSLDLAFNKIHSLENLQAIKTLKNLNLKWNSLTGFLEVLRKLKEMSFLKHLDLSWNPFRDVLHGHHEQFLVGRHLSSLVSYGGEPLARGVVGGQVTLSAHGSAPLVPAWRGVGQALTLKGRAHLANAQGNNIGVVGNHVVSVVLRNQLLTQFRSVFSLAKLKWLDVSGNLVVNAQPLRTLSALEELDVSYNVVDSFVLTGERFRLLTRLDLSHNYITTLDGFTEQTCPQLKMLDLSNNRLQTLTGISNLRLLVELYLSHNLLEDCSCLALGREWKALAVIDLSYNHLTKQKNYRLTCLYYIRSLKYIDGTKVLTKDVLSALSLFGGLLDQDYLIRVYSKPSLTTLTHLSLMNCSLKKVALPSGCLVNVASVALDHNKLSSLGWLQALPGLARLSLSHNRVCSFSNPDSCLPSADSGTPQQPLCPALRSLHLDHNRINNLTPLQLYMFPSLQVLFLNDNYISSLSGLNNMNNLERLVLDRNKLNIINTEHTEGLQNLTELYLERNMLTKLDFVRNLKKLQKLFVAFNKIGSAANLDVLGELAGLQELTLHGNPVSRRPSLSLSHLSTLRLLEGHPFNGDDESTQ